MSELSDDALLEVITLALYLDVPVRASNEAVRLLRMRTPHAIEMSASGMALIAPPSGPTIVVDPTLTGAVLMVEDREFRMSEGR